MIARLSSLLLLGLTFLIGAIATLSIFVAVVGSPLMAFSVHALLGLVRGPPLTGSTYTSVTACVLALMTFGSLTLLTYFQGGRQMESYLQMGSAFMALSLAFVVSVYGVS